MAVYPKHIPSIPYGDSQDRLQTYHVWLPRPLEQSDPNNSIWIVYVHGGAWRDPTQDALCAEPTIQHLLSSSSSSSSSPTSPLPSIAGIASINYRLSPYPNHPTHPSSPSDPSRNALHPTHIRDVTLAIQHLTRTYSIKRWLGVGHSCGATLLLQYVSRIGLPPATTTTTTTTTTPTTTITETPTPTPGPTSLILISGIYNIPLLLANHQPPSTPAPISQIYSTFITSAFTSDPNVHVAASPVTGSYSAQTWPEGRLLVLAHSHADELIERAQRDVMCVALDREGWSIVMEEGDAEREGGGRVLEVRDLTGGHDWIWEDGRQIAGLIGEVVGRLVRGL